ncbi:hypothetical protein JCM14469_33440 [Desulfatiferula olefinivorans]
MKNDVLILTAFDDHGNRQSTACRVNRLYDLKTHGSLPAERIMPFTFTVTSTFTVPEGNT